MSLGKEFFSREAEKVARNLLGCVIEREGMRARIVETEAYLGDDPASHAYPEKTERNRLMYETYGRIYVYICYGIHRMLNFTTDREGVGGVLVRAAEPLQGVERMRRNRDLENEKELCDGPGKLCEAMEIERGMNGNMIGEGISAEEVDGPEIEQGKRIGISKAVDRELRFFIPECDYVSTR